MALNKLKFNSLNVTPTAGKAVGFNSSADGLEATLSGGSMRFISKSTASSSSTISFTSGIDSTYKEYLFIFNNIHPASVSQFTFQANASGGSGYNETITSTSFQSFHREDDSSTSLNYRTGDDQAQGTSFQILTNNVGDDADQSCSGTLHLFNPSSTTFVKHFISRIQVYRSTGSSAEASSVEGFTAGYFNTNSAIDEIQFKMSSGNIDAGTITLYGIN
jgi:hypothetical protein